MGNLESIKCSKCGNEMEIGYIFSSREIAWTKDDKNRVAPGLLKYETLVKSTGFKVKKEVAFRCRDCKIVLFEYKSYR